MKNYEKFKSVTRRYYAFTQYCNNKTPKCDSCIGEALCCLRWLESDDSKEQVLACPFCGGEAKLYTKLDVKHGMLHFIKCQECFSRSSSYKTKEEAYTAWNRRDK